MTQFRTRKLTLGVLSTAASVGLIACQVSRYASLGIEGIDEQTAPYIAAKMVVLNEALSKAGEDVRNQTVSAVLMGQPMGCGTSAYSGTPGVFEAGETATISVENCDTGDVLRTYTVTFEEQPDSHGLTAEAFTARVEFDGILYGKIRGAGAFMLDYMNFGASDALTGDASFVSLTIRETAAAEPIVVSASETRQIEISAFHSQRDEMHDAGEAFDRAEVNFLLTEVGSGATLKVETTTPIVAGADSALQKGIVVLTDVDGATATFDFTPSPTTDYFYLTVDSDPSIEGNEFEGPVAYADLGIYPSDSPKASGSKGWL
jgi:hypothetical protein